MRYVSLGLGGGSPQLSWASRQCAELGQMMSARGAGVSAVPAMRYWHPYPEEAVSELKRAGARQFLVVPAYPQFSQATTGSVFSAVHEAIMCASPGAACHFVSDWHLLPGYLETFAASAESVIRRWAKQNARPRECAVMSVAHSLPERFIKTGDPYLDQTLATVDRLRPAVAARISDLGDEWDRITGVGSSLLAFQSKVGPVRWIGPDVKAETSRLAAAGCRRLLVLPVSFTCEHIETLHELDVELAEIAKGAGIDDFVRADALNLSPTWLESLADHLIVTAYRNGDFPSPAAGARASAVVTMPKPTEDVAGESKEADSV